MNWRRNAGRPGEPAGRRRRGDDADGLARRAAAGDIESARRLLRLLEDAAGVPVRERLDRALEDARSSMSPKEIVEVVASYVPKSAFSGYAPDDDRVRREYYADVKGIADDLAERMRSGEVARRGFDDALFEAVDGHQRVIYTSQAKEAVMVSNNAEAAFDEGLVDGRSLSSGMPWGAMAFAALRQDVYEELRERGMDPSDASSYGTGEDEPDEEDGDEEDGEEDDDA